MLRFLPMAYAFMLRFLRALRVCRACLQRHTARYVYGDTRAVLCGVACYVYGTHTRSLMPPFSRHRAHCRIRLPRHAAMPTFNTPRFAHAVAAIR